MYQMNWATKCSKLAATKMHFETSPCHQDYSLLAPWVNWFMGLHTQMDANRVYSTLQGRRKSRVGKTEIERKEIVTLENIVYKAHLLFWELQRAFLYISLVRSLKCLEPGEKKGWKNLREHYPPPSCCWNCYLNC